MYQTPSLSSTKITRQWHVLDASSENLGRLSTQIAALLMGKSKTNFVRYLDIADHVVVINAAKLKVTGNKLKQKNYYRHSGYPGGLKSLRLEQVIDRRPEFVIRHAVAGMLPKNRLQDKILSHLHIYPSNEHPYQKQFKKTLSK